MKKVGYFFYTFVPLLAVEAIQTIALFFMMGMGMFGQGFVGKLAFPSANVSDRLEKTFTSVNFNMMIMVIYALITIAILACGTMPDTKVISFHPLRKPSIP